MTVRRVDHVAAAAADRARLSFHELDIVPPGCLYGKVYCHIFQSLIAPRAKVYGHVYSFVSRIRRRFWTISISTTTNARTYSIQFTQHRFKQRNTIKLLKLYTPNSNLTTRNALQGLAYSPLSVIVSPPSEYF